MKLFIVALIAGTALAAPTLIDRQASPCDATKVAQLAGGIKANLFVQKQELEGILNLQKLQASNSTAGFDMKRQNVLAIQELGINIRGQNQAIAGEIKSPAIAGLKTVEGAQITEMRQVMGLTGNAKTDAAVLQTLVKEVEDGTKQNQANLKAAEGQCKK